MLMPGATDTDAALAANVIVRASFDSVIPGNELKIKIQICYEGFVTQLCSHWRS